jgi:hypothetical protein
VGSAPDPPRTEAQLTQLRNMRVHIEESKLIARELAYHRRAKLEARLDLVLAEIEREIEELGAEQS